MDIESKQWRIRSCSINPGKAEITNKATGQARYVPAVDLPSANRLAMMHESTFNREIASLYAESI